MTELSLVLGLVAGAGILAVFFARWVLSQDEGGIEARRLLRAVQRAGADFTGAQSRRALWMGGALWLLFAMAGPAVSHTPGRGLLLLTAGVIVGGVLAVGIGQLALQLAVQGAARTALALQSGAVGAVTDTGLRSSAAPALIAEGASLLVAVGSLVPVALDPSPASFRTLGLLATSVAAGALVPTLLGAITGGAMQLAGSTGRREPLLHAGRHAYQLDPRNPSLVLDVLGAHLAKSAVTIQSAFSVSLTTHAATAAAVLLALREAPQLGQPLLLLSLPLLVRGCGLAASGFAILLTHSQGSDEVESTILRGRLASVVLSVAALLGGSLWLLGADRYLPFFFTGLVGIVGSQLVGLRNEGRQGSRRQRELAEAARNSAPLGLSSSFARAFFGAAWAAVPIFVCAGVGWGAAPLLGVEGWGLSVALVLAGCFATHAHSVALSGFDSLVESACGLVSLEQSHQRLDVQHRLVFLGSAATQVGGIARSAASARIALLALTVAGVAPMLQLGPAPFSLAAPAEGVSAAAMLGSGTGAAMGLISVMVFCGLVLKHLATCALELKSELQGQLRAFTRGSDGLVELPAEFKPRYRDHLETAARSALKRAEIPCAMGLLVPLSLFLIVTRVAPGTPENLILPLSLSSFLFMASIAGWMVCALADTSRTSWLLTNQTLRAPLPEAVGARNPIDQTVDATAPPLAATELFVISAAGAVLIVTAHFF